MQYFRLANSGDVAAQQFRTCQFHVEAHGFQ
jgi:hypothetical protein